MQDLLRRVKQWKADSVLNLQVHQRAEPSQNFTKKTRSRSCSNIDDCSNNVDDGNNNGVVLEKDGPGSVVRDLSLIHR